MTFYSKIELKILVAGSLVSKYDKAVSLGTTKFLHLECQHCYVFVTTDARFALFISASFNCKDISKTKILY